MYYSDKHSQLENLGQTSRLLRAALGTSLIVFTMTTPATPLGWLAILPLLAIYPVFTAIIGWDPARAFLTHKELASKALNLSVVARVVAGLAGVVAIGSVYVASGTLGYVALLPLLGIYPIFAAILGKDPVIALYTMSQSIEDEAVEPELTVVETGKVAHHGDHYHEAA